MRTWTPWRELLLGLSALAGLWAGAAVPLAAFLLTGAPLPAVLVGSAATLALLATANELRGPGGRPWLRQAAWGAAAGRCCTWLSPPRVAGPCSGG